MMKLFKPRLVCAVSPQVDIVKGMYVMLDNGGESFWVHIASLFSHSVIGIVCTRLKKSRTYNFGDVLKFQTNNILDFFEKK
jgi:hypothetical protein